MRTKANIGLLLLIAFAVALTIGVILHLKSHGIIVEPRSALKVIHWVFGYAMTALVLVHWAQFRKMLGAMKKEIPLVLRRYTGIDYPVFGNVADRNGQTAGAG